LRPLQLSEKKKDCLTKTLRTQRKFLTLPPLQLSEKKEFSQRRLERKDDFNRCDLCGLARKKSSRRDAKNAKKVFKRCNLCSLARKKRLSRKDAKNAKMILNVATFAA